MVWSTREVGGGEGVRRGRAGNGTGAPAVVISLALLLPFACRHQSSESPPAAQPPRPIVTDTIRSIPEIVGAVSPDSLRKHVESLAGQGWRAPYAQNSTAIFRARDYLVATLRRDSGYPSADTLALAAPGIGVQEFVIRFGKRYTWTKPRGTNTGPFAYETAPASARQELRDLVTAAARPAYLQPVTSWTRTNSDDLSVDALPNPRIEREMKAAVAGAEKSQRLDKKSLAQRVQVRVDSLPCPDLSFHAVAESSASAITVTVYFDYVARAYNIVFTKPGETSPEQVVILCAHYDSFGGPGADDNASGTAVCLEAARILSRCRLARTLRIVFFTAEEMQPGRLGSKFYVSRLSAQDKGRIVAVLNVDTIASSILPSSRGNTLNMSQAEDLNISFYGSRTALVSHIVSEIRRNVPGLMIAERLESLSMQSSSDHESFLYDGSIGASILCFEEKSTPEFEKDMSFLHNPHDSVDRIYWGADAFFYRAARAVVAAAAAAAEPAKEGS